MNLSVDILHTMSMIGKNITDRSTPLSFLLRNSFWSVFRVNTRNIDPTILLDF